MIHLEPRLDLWARVNQSEPCMRFQKLIEMSHQDVFVRVGTLVEEDPPYYTFFKKKYGRKILFKKKYDKKGFLKKSMAEKSAQKRLFLKSIL